MRTPNLVRRVTLPLIILFLATLYVVFSANMGEWVRSRAGSPLIEVFVTR